MTIRIVSMILLACMLGCSSSDEGTNGSDVLDIAVTWKLVTNQAEGGDHEAYFRIRNNSDITLTPDNWEMYWSMAPRDVRQESIEAPVTISWINGDFYRMKPKDGFSLAPGEEMTINYKGSVWMIKESDGPLGLYSLLYNEEGEYEAYPISDYTVEPFETPEQIDRGTNDSDPIPTAEYLFAKYSRIKEVDEVPMILPQPSKITELEGDVSVSASTMVHYGEGLENEATLLTSSLNDHLSGSVPMMQSGAKGEGIIFLEERSVSTPGEYTLTISEEDGVLISGDKAGIFYGAQSLLAMVPVEQFGGENESISFKAMKIEDSPAFQYRGFFIDISRNFNSAETIKRVVDIMAFYKLNKLHIHLTEDEAWRIEIEELPELTEIASLRGHTTDDSEFLQPAYGSGPFPDPDQGYGSGYYTREQYKDLIKYAHDRHIQVIPEFNVPGHSRAAIKAMEYRYKKYMEQGNKEEAEKYRLADPEDESRYRSAQWYTDNVICVCRESAFTFVTTVLDDLIEMYKEAGVPLPTIHMGGDEVPRGAWSRSPICDEYMKDKPEIENPKNLQADFFRKVNDYLAGKGIVTSGWEEVAQTFAEDGSWTVNEEFVGGQVVPYVWNALSGAEDLGNKMANAGYPIIQCNVTNFYFDLAYNKDPREPGLYWGGLVDTRDAYDYVPYDVFKSIKTSAMGKAFKDEDFEGLERLTEEGKKNILGIQAQLWSETIKGQDMVEYYILPKLLALAERAWVGQPSWGDESDPDARAALVDESWNIFANRVGKRELPRLDKINGGYAYRLAPPGADIVNGRLEANVAYPGFEIRYTTDGSDPTAQSPVYEGPLEVGGGTIKLSTVDSQGRTSLPTVINLN